MAAVTVGLLSSAVLAQSTHRFSRARLVWRVAPGVGPCPGEEVFRREVARRLGAMPFEDSADTTLTIAIEATPDGALVGHTHALLADGSASPGTPVRVARGACRDLVSLLAGRIAVYLEDTASSPPADAAAAPDAAPDAALAPDASPAPDAALDAAPAPDAAPRVDPPGASPTPWRLEVGAGVLGEAFGDDPVGAVGLYAQARARRGVPRWAPSSPRCSRLRRRRRRPRPR